MKKQIFSLALSTLFGLGIAMAAPQSQEQSTSSQNTQSAERHRPDPQHQLQVLTKRLNLTDDQQKQILPILTDRQQQMESIRNDSSLSQKDRIAKMRSVREESDSKIKAVLTDDQKQTFDQMQQQMRERAHERREQQNAGSNKQ
jgi:periplasmic protein CpxP/Spy